MNAILGLAGVSLLVGFSIGSCSEPVPDTKVVTIKTPPKVLTHVEQDTEYIYETRGLPESCATVVDLIKIIVDNQADIVNLGKQAYQDISDITGDVMLDPGKVTDHQITLHNLTEKMDNALYTKALEAQNSMRNQYDACIADVEKSNDGEDVTVSDGETTKLYGTG